MEESAGMFWCTQLRILRDLLTVLYDLMCTSEMNKQETGKGTGESAAAISPGAHDESDFMISDPSIRASLALPLTTNAG
jgi:hypothetical protein